jgi:hypothetical protein
VDMAIEAGKQIVPVQREALRKAYEEKNAK